jgi:hypothetical protein
MAQLISNSDLVGSGIPTPRTAFTAGSRGFVSACALGAQGKRGIWIERQRTNMGRFVYGFVTADHRAPTAAGPGNAGVAGQTLPCAEIDGKCLYEVRNSYDLRGEDVNRR